MTTDRSTIVPKGLREDILNYYADPHAPIVTKKNARAWKKLMAELQILRQMKTEDAAQAANGNS
ncbi:MAG: hypothetical protein WA876_03480 [Candidatus Acidiferrales bacterium]